MRLFLNYSSEKVIKKRMKVKKIGTYFYETSPKFDKKNAYKGNKKATFFQFVCFFFVFFWLYNHFFDRFSKNCWLVRMGTFSYL